MNIFSKITRISVDKPRLKVKSYFICFIASPLSTPSTLFLFVSFFSPSLSSPPLPKCLLTFVFTTKDEILTLQFLTSSVLGLAVLSFILLTVPALRGMVRILPHRILCCGGNRQIHRDYRVLWRKRDGMATL